MGEMSYFGYVVILFTILIIVISIWNLFAFDKSNEDESVFFIINIISIILSVIILIWAIYVVWPKDVAVVVRNKEIRTVPEPVMVTKVVPKPRGISAIDLEEI